MPFIVTAIDLDESMEPRFGLNMIDIEDSYNYDDDAFFEGSKILVRLSDFFGWDDIIQLRDGGLFLTDRNCGYHSITTGPVDRADFLRKFKEYLDEKGAEYTEKDVILPNDG